MRVLVEAEVRQLRESYDVQRGSAMVVALCDSWLAQRDVVAAAQQKLDAVLRVLKDPQHTYGVIGDNAEWHTPMMTESDAIGAALGIEDWRAATVPEAEETPPDA